MTWKIVILDDETESIQKIKKTISRYFIKKKIDFKLYPFQNADLFLNQLSHLDFCHLFLLDVKMPNYSGLEIGRRIRDKYQDACIIYITNHPEYAPEAFEVGAFRYIYKRKLEEKLPQALDILTSEGLYSSKKAYRIQSHSYYENIPYKNIYYLYKEGKYVWIVHTMGKSRIRKAIQSVYEELNSEEFIFINQSCIVNIPQIMVCKNREITLRNQETVWVSTLRISDVRESLKKYKMKHSS